ncbi:MAG: CDP-alcohol phosphatidyltransferase family protein [Thermoplasmata archaeon]|nr:CDP-alcohol phosphatidyltransferase family protein [Thermoplasmata archaeon]
MRGLLPLSLTLANAAAGILAIHMTLTFASLYLISSLIVLGLLFDGLDGQIARMLKVESNMGVIMDSLSDIITFCLAPSMLIYVTFYRPGAISFASPYNGLVVSSVYLLFIFSLYRLIRYAKDVINGQGSKREFSGLPAPANALFVLSLLVVLHHLFPFSTIGRVATLSLILLISPLMATRVRYPRPSSLQKAVVAGLVIIFLILPTDYKIYPAVGMLTLSVYYITYPFLNRTSYKTVEKSPLPR